LCFFRSIQTAPVFSPFPKWLTGDLFFILLQIIAQNILECQYPENKIAAAAFRPPFRGGNRRCQNRYFVRERRTNKKNIAYLATNPAVKTAKARKYIDFIFLKNAPNYNLAHFTHAGAFHSDAEKIFSKKFSIFLKMAVFCKDAVKVGLL
jgi:hypothetical protein